MDAKHKFVDKPWGWEEWVVNKPEYCGKILFLKKGRALSWHVHRVKDEVFLVIEGKMKVMYGYKEDRSDQQEIVLSQWESFHIPTGMIHQMTPAGDGDCKFIEFSTQHFDEDSIRIEPGY